MKKYINLNPKILNKSITKENIDSLLKKILIIALCIGVSLYVIVTVNDVIITKKTNDINKKLNEDKGLIEENDTLKKSIVEKEKFLGKIDVLRKEKDNNSKILSNIGNLIPVEIKFNNFTIINKEINIVGESTNYNSITEMLANLQTSENYSKSHLNSITYDKSQGIYIFNIVIKELQE